MSGVRSGISRGARVKEPAAERKGARRGRRHSTPLVLGSRCHMRRSPCLQPRIMNIDGSELRA
jgi:hypothetical protein